jgi:2-oxoacid:acceptor oxidoreductase gamma subunit (pyruvate/2-ketoisovalerate family)
MINIKFYGLGGQGVVTAAKALSVAVSIHEDKYAVTIPAFRHERRGAPVYTDIRIDDVPVLANCHVYEPDIVLVMDETITEKGIDISAGKHPDAFLVLNTADKSAAESYRDKYGFKDVYYVDATTCAINNIGRNIPNGAMLGALAKTGIVDIKSIESALKEIFGERAGDKNARAATEAYQRTEKL